VVTDHMLPGTTQRVIHPVGAVDQNFPTPRTNYVDGDVITFLIRVEVPWQLADEIMGAEVGKIYRSPAVRIEGHALIMLLIQCVRKVAVHLGYGT
jgi:hypothetical protein